MTPSTPLAYFRILVRLQEQLDFHAKYNSLHSGSANRADRLHDYLCERAERRFGARWLDAIDLGRGRLAACSS